MAIARHIAYNNGVGMNSVLWRTAPEALSEEGLFGQKFKSSLLILLQLRL
jgi:hypothetical protein